VHDFVPAALRPYSEALGRRVRDLEARARNLLARVNRRPLFVLGNQKSGTTAVAALLAGATGRSVTLDLSREVWAPSFHTIPDRLSFEDFVARHRFAFSRDIVKEPNLTLFHEELVRVFPEASFLFVSRDPRDNLRSLLDRVGVRGDLESLPADHALPNPGWRLVLDSSWRGIPGEHYIERLAHRWCFCAEVYLRNAGSMTLCRYEDFDADKSGTIARLAGELGLPLEADVSERLGYPFQPPGDRSRAWVDFFGGDNLARIEAICAQGMRALGYAS